MGKRFASLGHPIFLVALALLVSNDHVLKGSGLLPGVVTGKLSDLAGMIVAPVLVASLVGPYSLARRVAAFALVAALFAAVKLSAGAAALAEIAMGAIGVPWELWADPTDLAMLAIALPLAELVVRHAERGRVLFAGEGSRHARTGLAALSALACVGTSVPEPAPLSFNATAYVVNRTTEPFDLRVRWLAANVRCEMIRDSYELALGREAFGSAVAFRIEPDHTIPLDRQALRFGFESDGSIDAALSQPRTPNACDAVLIEGEGVRSTIVFLEGGTVESVAEHLLPDAVQPSTAGELALTMTAAGFDLVPARIEPRPFIADIGASSCSAPVAYDWSVPAESLANYAVKELDATPDGCTRIVLEQPAEDVPRYVEARRETIYLCVPGTAAAFELGDRITISPLAQDGVAGVHLLRARGSRVAAELYLFRATFGDLTTISVDAFELAVEPSACDGERDACGAYGERGRVSMRGREGTLAPGESARFDEGGGLFRTIYVGDARRGSVTVENACAPELALGGTVLALVQVEYAEAK
jgi:hypothetical protein